LPHVVDIGGKFSTGGKFSAGVVDTGGKFAAGVVDTDGVLSLVNIFMNFPKKLK
jgi:hypothetical protein